MTSAADEVDLDLDGIGGEQIELVAGERREAEIAARIRTPLTRLTGTRDAWLRLNGPFVTAIRRRFLHWRAVSPDQKAELFAEAKGGLARHAD